ncbi:hypothetical protein AB0F77_15495 [Streptomyces sp. NPDC026672]|uniref:hypothetical protein n=1 Tax=unclassified Streptomyces TaxID=2593676 RepID=UPI003411C542
MTAPHWRTTRSGAGLRVLRAAVFAAVCVVLAAAGHTLASCVSVPLWTLGAGFLGTLVLVVPLAGRARSLPGIATVLALGQTALHTLFGLGQHGAMAAASGSMPMGSTGSMGSMGSMGSAGSMASMPSMAAVLPSAVLPSGSPASVSGLSDAALVERAARLVCGTGAAAISPAHAYRLLTDARLIDASGTDMGGMHHTTATGGSWTQLLPSLPMLLAHVLAAVAAGWVLRHGDLALLRLIELSAHGVAETALVRSLRAAFTLVRALCGGLPAAPEALRGPRRTADDGPPAPHTTALQHTVIRRGPPAAAFLLAA